MGNRYHPIFSEWRYHSGMDIGASYGSSVIASDSGTICYCGEKGGYGNCIMIDHGNGYYTLYGHLSGYAVSYEQTVTKGQTIGYVGSSGWATGPHLHFEIRSGSTALDPEAVAGFSGLTYAADAGE
jgi:murein DD-endopeptidase MepM/ murein hydrolase activator NlpD